MATGGIDIGKHRLFAGVDTGEAHCEAPNDAQGWEAITAWLRERDVREVGMEPSGVYGRGVQAHLREAGFIVLEHRPGATQFFAKSMGLRAKNDRLDAGLIAKFTAVSGAKPREIDPRIDALRPKLRFLEQACPGPRSGIEEDYARWKTRREACHDKAVFRQIEARLRALRKDRDRLRADLLKALRQHADLAFRFDLVTSIPGLGERTALAVVIDLPELGALTREQAAALVGVAPYDHDSGERKGERHVGGGRGRVRRALYAAALPAAFHWNPQLKTFYQRLSDREKHHKATLTACVRKLVIYANTVLKRGTPWTENHDQINAPA